MLSTLLIPTLLSSLTAGAAELPPALAADYELLLDGTRHQADSLVVSPDGRWAVASVHTEETHYLEYYREEWRRVLVLVDLSDGSRDVLTAPAEDAHAPVWLPGSRGVAFFARRDGRHGVEVLELSGRERRRVAEMPDDGSGPLDWGPWLLPAADGRFLLYAVQGPGAWWERHVDRLARGPAALPEAPIVIGPEERMPLLQAQGLGVEFFGQGPPMAVLAVPVAGGPARELATGEDLPAAPYVWGAAGLLDGAWDGERGRLLVADGPAVRVVPLGAAAPEAAAVSAAELPGPVLLRRVLPDGTVLLLVARRAEPSSELLIPTGRDLWEIVAVTTAEAGGVRTESRARGPALPDGYPQALAADGRRLVVWRAVGPGAALVAYDLASGGTVELLGADGVAKRRVAWLPAVDPAAEELLAVRSTATEPEVLVRVGLDGSSRPVPGRWPGVPAELPAGAVETVRWQAPDGKEIEGVLVTPDDGARGRPYPTLLYLHGGPDVPVPADLDYLASGRSQSAAHLLARAGYAVLVPYFRGTGGYGDRFAGDLGNGRLYSAPAADSLAGIDALVERGVADPERLGVYGHSFGGMLTAWIVARDHRFRAAISSVGFLDTLARDRTSRGAFHASPGLGGPDDDPLDAWRRPELYRELSPLERAFEVETPTLLVSTAAEQDHLPGYAAFFNALRLREVPTLWLHFPGANHTGSWSPAEQRDYAAHALAWFDRFLRAEGESSARPEG